MASASISSVRPCGDATELGSSFRGTRCCRCGAPMCSACPVPPGEILCLGKPCHVCTNCTKKDKEKENKEAAAVEEGTITTTSPPSLKRARPDEEEKIKYNNLVIDCHAALNEYPLVIASVLEALPSPSTTDDVTLASLNSRYREWQLLSMPITPLDFTVKFRKSLTDATLAAGFALHHRGHKSPDWKKFFDVKSALAQVDQLRSIILNLDASTISSSSTTTSCSSSSSPP
jgi:hypothetical protein